jgi:hypothetical protein
MAESKLQSILSLSEVLLFGIEMEDVRFVATENKGNIEGVKVTAATIKNVDVNAPSPDVDEVTIKENQKILVRKQEDRSENGIYEVTGVDVAPLIWTKQFLEPKVIVKVRNGEDNEKTWWKQKKGKGNRITFKLYKGSRKRNRRGTNRFLEDQANQGALFARIYGFSYEGSYFELASPTLFLVHGEGELVTPKNEPPEQGSRAPTDPSRTGVAAAEFQFSNDMRVWSYDKADFTVRMDVETGMLEQVLLDAYFGGDEGAFVSGSKVSGSKVSGSKVSGSKVRGSKLRGPGD